MVDTVNDSPPADVSFEYEVIGEHLIDPLRLLTIDAEGQLFELNLESGSTSPTILSEDWIVDTVDATPYWRRPGSRIAPALLVVG
jgi:hypothetical protein